MAENQTRPTKVSVAKFIETIPDETRRADAKVLVRLMQNESGEKAAMWGPAIIGFGSVHYKYESGREGDMPLIGFSPRKAASVHSGAAWMRPRWPTTRGRAGSAAAVIAAAADKSSAASRSHEWRTSWR